MIRDSLHATKARSRRGMTHEQVADAMQLSVSMVRKIELEALEKLRYKCWHENLSLSDLLGPDAGLDEGAPFAGVEAHSVGDQ